MTLSLKYRIAIIIFVLEAFMMAAVLWQTLGYTKQETEKQLVNAENAIFEIINGLSRVALLTEEYVELQVYMEDLLKVPRIKQALLVDIRGRVVAASDAELIGNLPPPNMHSDPIVSDDAHFWRIKQVSNKTGQLGVLALEISNQPLIAATQAAQKLGISIAIIGMSIIAVIGVLVGYVLTRQLQLVTNSASAFTAGDMSARTNLDGKDEVSILGQTFDKMADTISENQQQLESTISERTRELELRNKELESFSYSVSHDLRTPLRGIDGFSKAILEDYHDRLDEQGKKYLERIRTGVQKMGELIDDMLSLSRTAQAQIKKSELLFSDLCNEILTHLAKADRHRKVEVVVESDMIIFADRNLMGVMLENLLGNAWKYTGKTNKARIEVGSFQQGKERIYFIKDNGAGFDMRHSSKLFTPFQRLHKGGEFSGTGIGLATVDRIVQRHGGRIWAEAEVDKGATFYFTLPDK